MRGSHVSDGGPAIGDEEGCAPRLRAAPLFARAACTRAKLLAAMPLGCKHDAESDDLEPEADVVARAQSISLDSTPPDRGYRFRSPAALCCAIPMAT
jgi:hypothetical protein